MTTRFLTDIQFEQFYSETVDPANEIQQLAIEVNMEFNGKAELIGFTQYVTGLLVEHFPNYMNLQVSISSINGQEALIVRDAGAEKPFVHIY